MNADMARAGLAELQPVTRLEGLVADIDAPKRKVAMLETTQYMRNQLLRDSDWAGMAHSLEIRVPLVDRVVFETLAPHVLRPGGPTKQKMAETPKTPLPDSIINRPKTGFAIPVDRWMEDRSGVKERGFRGWAQTVFAAATQ